jgi:hypothetical protein
MGAHQKRLADPSGTGSARRLSIQTPNCLRYGWFYKQLEEEACSMTMGRPVMEATGKPAVLSTRVSAAWAIDDVAAADVQPGAKRGARSGGERSRASAAAAKVPLLLPPPAVVRGRRSVGLLSQARPEGEWEVFDAPVSCEMAWKDSRSHTRQMPPRTRTWKEFTPCIPHEGAADVFDDENAPPPHWPPRVNDDNAEYWWSAAGQQEAISQHRRKPLVFGELWDFKRKHAFARAAHKLSKRLPTADAVRSCLSPNAVQAFQAVDSAVGCKKSIGFWKS